MNIHNPKFAQKFRITMYALVFAALGYYIVETIDGELLVQNRYDDLKNKYTKVASDDTIEVEEPAMEIAISEDLVAKVEMDDEKAQEVETEISEDTETEAQIKEVELPVLVLETRKQDEITEEVKEEVIEETKEEEKLEEVKETESETEEVKIEDDVKTEAEIKTEEVEEEKENEASKEEEGETKEEDEIALLKKLEARLARYNEMIARVIERRNEAYRIHEQEKLEALKKAEEERLEQERLEREKLEQEVQDENSKESLEEIIEEVIEEIVEEVDPEKELSSELLDSGYAFQEIDWEGLQSENKDICAWIESGSNIDYPIVIGEDNGYYLKHDITGKNSSNGTLFFDSNVNPVTEGFGDFTVIYGHNMKSGKMFGTIDNYYYQDYYNNNKFGVLYTSDGRVYKIEYFAARFIDADNPIIMDENLSQEELFEKYISDLLEASTFKTDIDVKYGDNILVLSTCAYTTKNARINVYGKLVEQKTKSYEKTLEKTF